MRDLRDFACPACGGWLPDYPVHTDHATYCSAHCRDWAEPDWNKDEED